MYNPVEFSSLVGKTLTEITVKDDQSEIRFKTMDQTFLMHHYQSCCESVLVEEIIGDLNDLLNSPVLMAEVSTNNTDKLPEGVSEKEDRYFDESFTWTFYKIRTLTGDVTIRWFGGSNGYYGEEVDFELISQSNQIH